MSKELLSGFFWLARDEHEQKVRLFRREPRRSSTYGWTWEGDVSGELSDDLFDQDYFDGPAKRVRITIEEVE